MLNPRALALAVALLPALLAQGFAAPPPEALKKKIVDAYAKIDKLSISCFVYERVADSDGPQLAVGSVEYRFDRATKQLAIGTEGVPILLVKNNQLFVRAFQDDEEVATYVEINKPNAITWRDIDDAWQIVQTRCPLGEKMRLPCFVLPFLGGGADKLLDSKAELLTENDPKEPFIFGLGHPDCQLFFGGTGVEEKKLDPKKSPLCIRTKDDGSTWNYAFDRNLGTMTAAQGVVPSEQCFGIPGRRIEFFMRRVWSFSDGPSAEAHEVAFALPENAKRVSSDHLRASYVAELGHLGVKTLIERQKEAQKALIAASDKESELVAKIARQRAAATVNQAELKKNEADLKELRVEKIGASFLAKEVQAVVDELQHQKKSPELRK